MALLMAVSFNEIAYCKPRKEMAVLLMIIKRVAYTRDYITLPPGFEI